MNLYEETCRKIKALEIQGAENIAVSGIRAFGEKLKETQDEVLLKKYIAELSSLRETEPALRNGLQFCFINRNDPEIIEKAVKYFHDSKEKIAEIGAKKIHNGMTVFTHCHASTVTKILTTAWDQGKKFSVVNTETRPKFQGRKTAEELAKHGIPVTHYVDSGGRLALKEADIFLFGADAITSEGNVINKIGTTMFAEFANLYNVPAYSCSNSWKFDPATVQGADEPIEERAASEVWDDAPKGVHIMNPAFELTASDKITGIITELGVYKSESLLSQVKAAYPWMLSSDLI